MKQKNSFTKPKNCMEQQDISKISQRSVYNVNTQQVIKLTKYQYKLAMQCSVKRNTNNGHVCIKFLDSQTQTHTEFNVTTKTYTYRNSSTQ